MTLKTDKQDAYAMDLNISCTLHSIKRNLIPILFRKLQWYIVAEVHECEDWWVKCDCIAHRNVPPPRKRCNLNVNIKCTCARHLSIITFIRYAQSRNIRKSNHLKSRPSKPRDLNRIAKISKGHMCMTEENLSDDSNYTTCSAI